MDDADYPDDGYRDPAILRELYWEECLTQEEIGEIFGVAGCTVGQHMRDLGVETRADEGQRYSSARLRELFCENDMTPGEIAEQYDVTERTIRNWLRDEGIEISQPPIESVDEGEEYKRESVLRELYCGELLPMKEIAERFDISEKTVNYWLDEYDIDRIEGSQRRAMKKVGITPQTDTSDQPDTNASHPLLD